MELSRKDRCGGENMMDDAESKSIWDRESDIRTAEEDFWEDDERWY
jgi:hypothetical protein